MLYYILITIISIALVLTSYFAPDALSFLGNETSQRFANVGMNLLWITLFVKPIFMLLVKHTELKTSTFSWLWDYLKTIKGRSLKWLWYMLLSVVYFFAGLGMKWRRQLGIATFLAIVVHSGLWITRWMSTNFTLVNQLQTRYLLAGYIGILCLFVGYITSNNFSIRILKSRWKTIQYTSYIALLFAILHLMLLNPGEYFGQVIVLVIYIVSKLIEKKKIRIS